MGNTVDIALQLAAFALTVAFFLAAERSLIGFLAVRRRLGEDPTRRTRSTTSIVKTTTVSNRFLLWVQSATTPKDPAETGKLRRRLALAGFDRPAASIWYVICRFGLAIGLPLSFLGISALTGQLPTGLGAIVFPLALCGAGLLLPFWFVGGRIKSRRAELEDQFPDSLDLLVVCVEAGLALEAAFVRVANEVKESHPRVAYEFGALAQELSAGRSRADALRAMAGRVDVSAVTAFVALLVQSDALGVSVAQSLRTYSIEMRESRFLKAEEKAMRIPVLMTLPIVACFMPVIIVALLLPPTIDVVRVLMPSLAPHGAP